MSRALCFLVCALAFLASPLASAEIVEHSFHVQNLTVERLCSRQVITAVNDRLPGPTIVAREGDTVVIHVFNKSPYNITIHWHGVFQRMTPWADGPSMITQCPIRPGGKYTYKYNVIDQEGTKWWHAHVNQLRATVHGALIFLPRLGNRYPFPEPHNEIPIILGEWWNANVVDVQNQAVATGGPPNVSDAYTINGMPGDLYPCSQYHIYEHKVKRGKYYLLRIINAAVNNQLFFKIANHNLTVVAVDASYTNPYPTDVVAIAPGQTVDALLFADQAVGSYFMAASPYISTVDVPFDNTTTRAILYYDGATSATPVMPLMPATNDTPTAHKFYTNLTSLRGRHWVPVPRQVDEHMFMTIGLSYSVCSTCLNGTTISGNVNNESFVPPTTLSLLQAHFFHVSGIYTTDFPDAPGIEYDYTNASVNNNSSLIFAPKTTKLKVLKYNAVVEIVLQDTAILVAENHPIHIHGFDFHVLAQGFGNYDPVKDRKRFNLVNPQMRNTIAVPVGGWAVIRFRANNPGVWFMHCHLDAHLTFGLAMAFVNENGPSPNSILPPPPADLPQC
ncbi:Laccase-7 [Turnera subulata]|uniref:Laccase n=1 Tax=Turnera subulata TaxID=218843 RepID=A0A9Q0JCA7_9ROSI|nr:Laccase-7 [Turnera subulata]